MNEEKKLEAEKLLSSPLHFPDIFKTWLADYVATNIPLIPFSHIFGSRMNIARSGAYIATSESTTASGYQDLTTVGPQLQNLADGTYLVMYGAAGRGYASISVNGVAPSDDDAIYANESDPQGARMKIVSMKSNNQNSVKLQYKAPGNSFSKRWLTVIRVGAP